MKQTPRGYPQPELSDKADIRDVSDAIVKIDTDITALESQGKGTGQAVTAHIQNTLNPHKVTAEQVDAYTRGEIDSRVEGYDNHIRDKDNPHDTSPSQIGAYSIDEINELLENILKDSAYITWENGQGTVNLAEFAELAQAAKGVVTQTLSAGANLNTIYGLDHNEFYVAGNGNTVANKPTGVDSFQLFAQRGATGFTLQALYCSTTTAAGAEGLWYRGWNGSTWSDWVQLAAKYLINTGTKAAPVFNGDVQGGKVTATSVSATSMTLNGNTITEWPTGGGGGGGSGKRYATFVIGTTLAGHSSADVDYLCDGVNDEAKINAAIIALPSTGGSIEILDGQYNTSSPIEITTGDCTLRGQGTGTIINCTSGLFGILIGGNRNIVKDLQIIADSSVMYGITTSNNTTRATIDNVLVSGVTSAIGAGIHTASSTTVQNEHMIKNCTILGCYTGISSAGKKCSIENNLLEDCNTSLTIAGAEQTVTRNTIKTSASTGYGMVLNSRYNTIENNRFTGTPTAIYSTSSDCIGNDISGNTFIGSSTVCIQIVSGSANIVRGNRFVDSQRPWRFGATSTDKSQDNRIHLNSSINVASVPITGENNEASLNTSYGG